MTGQKLPPHSHVVTAWAEHVSGPGWTNRVVWYILKDGNGKLSMGCLQPEDQTAVMQQVFGFSELASLKMASAVEEALK